MDCLKHVLKDIHHLHFFKYIIILVIRFDYICLKCHTVLCGTVNEDFCHFKCTFLTLKFTDHLFMNTYVGKM